MNGQVSIEAFIEVPPQVEKRRDDEGIIINGNTLDALRGLPAGTADMCITSPPYWGLRDYGKSNNILWDADPNCEHEWDDYIRSGIGGGAASGMRKRHEVENFQVVPSQAQAFCKKCGGWRGQLGLEPSPELYVKHLCDIMDEIKRVLKDEGTIYVNIGDTYSGSGGAGGDYNDGGLREGQPRYRQVKPQSVSAKSLVLVPMQFAIEMVQRGWILRNTLIWHKPNAMPQSARDRFSVDYEYIFFFSKQQKYYFDTQYEPLSEDTVRDLLKRKNLRWGDGSKGSKYFGKKQEQPLVGGYDKEGRTRDEFCNLETGRVKRCVWSINTKPYAGAHFATFPPELLVTPIRASTSERGGCPKCGKQYVRMVERVGGPQGDHNAAVKRDDCTLAAQATGHSRQASGSTLSERYRKEGYPERKTLGWEPQCDCGLEPVPCVVLDPFMGSGTTALVARKLGRKYLGLEINPEYIELARQRLMEDIILPDERVVTVRARMKARPFDMSLEMFAEEATNAGEG